VSLAHIAVQSDVLASDASARIRRRPADDGAPEPASSTESIIEDVRTADAGDGSTRPAPRVRVAAELRRDAARNTPTR
jgi:hypothetical protein